MSYRPRWQPGTHSFHFPKPDEKTKFQHPRQNTNRHFEHRKLEPLTRLQWQINYYELLIYLPDRFLLIVIFFRVIQMYMEDNALTTLGVSTLLRRGPRPASLDTHRFRNCRQGWPLILLAPSARCTRLVLSWHLSSQSDLWRAALDNTRAQTTLGHPPRLTWSLCLWVS